MVGFLKPRWEPWMLLWFFWIPGLPIETRKAIQGLCWMIIDGKRSNVKTPMTMMKYETTKCNDAHDNDETTTSLGKRNRWPLWVSSAELQRLRLRGLEIARPRIRRAGPMRQRELLDRLDRRHPLSPPHALPLFEWHRLGFYRIKVGDLAFTTRPYSTHGKNTVSTTIQKSVTTRVIFESWNQSDFCN